MFYKQIGYLFYNLRSAAYLSLQCLESLASIPPNMESKSGATSRPVLGSGPLHFFTQIFPFILGFSPFREKVLLMV